MFRVDLHSMNSIFCTPQAGYSEHTSLSIQPPDRLSIHTKTQAQNYLFTSCLWRCR